MDRTRASRTFVLVAVLAGIVLALGLCARPITSPRDETRDRSTRESRGEPADASGRGPDEVATSGPDAEGAAADDAEPERRVTLVVRVQDGPSGSPVEARAVVVRHGSSRSRAIPLRRAGSVFTRENLALDGLALFVTVTPPPGLVQETPATNFDVRISDKAETLIATVVVWPEFMLGVEVRDRGGILVPDAFVWARRPSPGGYRKILAEATTDTSGVVHFGGLPLIPDEPILVHAYRDDARARVETTPTRPGHEHLVRLVLPASFGGRPREGEPEQDVYIHATTLVDRSEEPTDDAPETRAVEVRVVDDRGRPVPSARVWTDRPSLEGTTQFLARRTDAAGRLVLEGVPRSGRVIGAGLGTRHAQHWLEGSEDQVTLTIRRKPSGESAPEIRGHVTAAEDSWLIHISVGSNDGVRFNQVFDVFRREDGIETRVGKIRVDIHIGGHWAYAQLMTGSRMPMRGDRIVTSR